jgi:hypothetical protein
VRTAGGAKERRKPARGGKAMGTVAGSLRESGKGALVDGRRLGSGKPLALTRGRWKRSWRSANAQQWAFAGRDRGRQRPDHRPSARLITPRQGSSACARSSSPPFLRRRDAGGSSEAGEAPSSADPPGVGLPQGGLTPRSGWHGANALGSLRRRSSRRELRARESGDIRVLVSSVGCRGR